MLERHRARFDGIWTDNDYPPGLVVGVIASVATRGRSVGELHALGRELEQLLEAVSGSGVLTARSAYDLVQAGRAAVIVGQREGPWLDVEDSALPSVH